MTQIIHVFLLSNLSKVHFTLFQIVILTLNDWLILWGDTQEPVPRRNAWISGCGCHQNASRAHSARSLSPFVLHEMILFAGFRGVNKLRLSYTIIIIWLNRMNKCCITRVVKAIYCHESGDAVTHRQSKTKEGLTSSVFYKKNAKKKLKWVFCVCVFNLFLHFWHF